MTKKWVRPKNAPIAGVCGAFANALEASPVVVRMTWLIAGLIFGTGFFLYIVCWWFLPKEENQFDPDTASFLGVCLRISQKTGIEIAIVRIAVFLSFFASAGITLLGYFVAHLLIPKTEAPKSEPPKPATTSTPT
jgi:phage shock protein PspC (stress-responsive transcriptional regulator)